MPTSVTGAIAQKVSDAFPDLSATDQRIAVGLYRLLAEGEPVSPVYPVSESGTDRDRGLRES